VWRRRCGRVAARSRSPVLMVPPSAVLGAAAVRCFGNSGGGFAARARTAGHCRSFYDGPAVADDPVARRRPFELGPPRSRPTRRSVEGVTPLQRIARIRKTGAETFYRMRQDLISWSGKGKRGPLADALVPVA
jgi:hypothetical protein